MTLINAYVKGCHGWQLGDLYQTTNIFDHLTSNFIDLEEFAYPIVQIGTPDFNH